MFESQSKVKLPHTLVLIVQDENVSVEEQVDQVMSVSEI